MKLWLKLALVGAALACMAPGGPIFMGPVSCPAGKCISSKGGIRKCVPIARAREPRASEAPGK